MSENQQHPIEGVMETAMRNLKEMVDVNTVVGDAITTPDGTVIIPVSKVNMGFASGGSDFTTKHTSETNRPCFGGGSGAGVTILPVAFLVVTPAGGVSMLPVDQPQMSVVDKAIDMVPGMIDKIKEMIDKNKQRKEEQNDAAYSDFVE